MHENLIQRADLLQRLLRGLDIKGQRGAALTLDPTVAPVVVLEDLTAQSVGRDPLNRRAFGSVTAGPVAGQQSIATLLNPAGSGVLVIVKGFHCAPSTTMTTVFGLADPLALPPTLATPWWMDPRNPGVPGVRFTSGTDAVLRIVTELVRINAGTTAGLGPAVWPPDFALVIREGQAFGAQVTLANTAATFTFLWDEVQVT